MERSVESVFAEYQKELLEEYDIFGLDGSYETDLIPEDRGVGSDDGIRGNRGGEPDRGNPLPQ